MTENKVRRISATQINVFNICPRKYYERYILGNKDPETLPMYMGTIVHATLEEFFNLVDHKIDEYTDDNYEQKLFNHLNRIFIGVWDEHESHVKELIVLTSPCSINDELETVKDNIYTQAKHSVETFIRKISDVKTYKQDIKECIKIAKPTYSELEVKTDIFIGYIDAVFDLDGEIIIKDYKTSKYSSGKKLKGRWTPGYSTKYKTDYIAQTFIYLWALYKTKGIIADTIILEYVKYGEELVIPLKVFEDLGLINRIDIIEEVDKFINWFYEYTKSDDINDYPMNNENIQHFPELKIKLFNGWCSMSGTRWDGRGFCNRDQKCNEECKK